MCICICRCIHMYMHIYIYIDIYMYIYPEVATKLEKSQLPQQADRQVAGGEVAATNTEVIRVVHGHICVYLYAYQYICIYKVYTNIFE